MYNQYASQQQQLQQQRHHQPMMSGRSRKGGSSSGSLASSGGIASASGFGATHPPLLHAAGASFSRSDDSLDDDAMKLSASRRKLAPLRPNSALGLSLSSSTPLPGLPLKPRTPSPMSASNAAANAAAAAASDKAAELSSSLHRLSSENEAHRRFQARASEASSSLRTETKDLKVRVGELETSLEKARAATAAAKAEGERRERVLEALLKQARAEKIEAQKTVGRLTSQVEVLKKDNDKLTKVAKASGGTGTGPSSASARAAAASSASQVASLKMQVDAYKGELEVKDKQIVALRYELESRPLPGAGGGGGGGGVAKNGPVGPLDGSLEDLDDGDSFEEVLKEEMETMKAAYEARIAALQEKLERAGVAVKRQDEDVTALPTPR